MNKEKKKYYLFFVVLLLFCTAKAFAVNTPDYDLWARLLVGKHFFQTFSLMTQDIFSYTPTHFWYDHEWGSSVVFYGVLKYFGDHGLVILKALLMFSVMFIIHKCIELRGVKSTKTYNILFYIFTFLASFQIFAGTIRCHLFTFLFFTLWIYLLERVRNGEKKWLYYFPFMMIFWNNLHGGCVSGIGLLVIYIIGEFLNKKPVKDYLVSLLLSCFALLINPYGPKYIEFLLKATTMKRPLITEWRGTFDKYYLYDYIKFKAFFIVMVLSAVIAPIKEKISYSKLDKTKYLLLLVTAYLSISHIKHQPFFVISAAIFLYDDFYFAFNSLTKKIREIFKIKSERIIARFVFAKELFVYSLIILVSIVYLAKNDGEIKISKYKYPIFAVEFVRLNHLKGNLFVDFSYGSYAAYKLYPNNLIVMDGRYEEVYYPELLEELRDFHQAKKSNWQKIITDYKTDVIIIEKKYPAYKKLISDKKWSKVFEDSDFAVLIPQDGKIIDYIYPPNYSSYYDATKFSTDVDFLDKKSK